MDQVFCPGLEMLPSRRVRWFALISTGILIVVIANRTSRSLPTVILIFLIVCID